MITFVTGSRNRGKSSYLRDWYLQQPEGTALFSLKRFVKGEHTGYDLLLEPGGILRTLCSLRETASLSDGKGSVCGKYIFDDSVFEEAYRFVLKATNNNPQKIIWLDEVGNLELQKKGFYPIIRLAESLNFELRIGIRSSCLVQFINMSSDWDFRIINLDLNRPSFP